MYCRKCGEKIDDNSKFCINCGEKINIENEEKVINNNDNNSNNKYSILKLVIGIISMVLFILISIQSCAAGFNNAIRSNNEITGSLGFICALLMLSGGIVSVASRNSNNKGGTIACLILFCLAKIVTLNTGDSYPDLPIWGNISFIFGIIHFISLINKKDKNNKYFIIGIIIVSITALLIGFSFINEDNNCINNSNIKENNSSTIKEEEKEEEVKSKYSLNETFVFDDLEITLGSNITYTKVNNKYYDHYNETVVKLPITIKNIKEESHKLSYFDLTIFESTGEELDDLYYFYIMDDSIYSAGDLRTGASYTKYLYFLYDGNGTYSIEFDDYFNKKTVEFEINK